MRKRVASAITAGATAVATTVVAMIWPTIDPQLGAGLLAACGVALVIAAVLYFWPGSDSGQERPLQSTVGSGSHNIQTRDGPVTINNNYGHTQQPEPAPPPESPWNDPKFSLLGGERSISPDTPLSAVLSRLYEIYGAPDDEQEGAMEAMERKVRDAIVDAAYHRRIDVWGRMNGGGPSKLVWRDAWERGQFSVSQDEVTYRSPDNPHGKFQWKGLMFNREQVDRCWPPRPNYEMIIV